jgi:hypothetical protein
VLLPSPFFLQEKKISSSYIFFLSLSPFLYNSPVIIPLENLLFYFFIFNSFSSLELQMGDDDDDTVLLFLSDSLSERSSCCFARPFKSLLLLLLISQLFPATQQAV